MNMIGRSPNGMGIANAFVTVALMDLLIAKGTISKSEARVCFAEAMKPLFPNESTISVKDALHILADMQGHFPE